MSLPWEKVLHQWANAKGVLSTLNVDAAEDEHIMFVTSDVPRVVTEKQQPYAIMRGKQKL